MTSRSFRLACLVGGLAGSLAACGDPARPNEVKNPGQGTCDSATYPCGPFGYVQGSIVEDLKLVGQRDDNGNGTPTDDPIRDINLHEYYKDKNIKVLVVMVAAEWCSPCRAEQPGLIDLYSMYKDSKSGVAFVEAIIQDKSGKPADMVVADRWATNKWGPKAQTIPFDIAADPTVALGPYYNVAAFPMQMVIKTKDMSIDWQNNGLANEQLRQHIDDILASSK